MLSSKLKIGLLLSFLFILPQLCRTQPIEYENLKHALDSVASENLFSGSILVGVDSSVAFYHSAGFSSRNPRQPIDTSTTFEIASLTKQFTAALILKLFEERFLLLHDPIGKYLEWYSDTYKDSVTIHHIINSPIWHSKLYKSSSMAFSFNTTFRKKTFVKQLLASKPLQFTPGSDFSYNNSNYYLLGLIAEEVTKKPYKTLLIKYLFAPLKMDNMEL